MVLREAGIITLTVVQSSLNRSGRPDSGRRKCATRPAGFSFADAIVENLGIPHEPTPPPCAVSFRVGEAWPEGTLIASWTRPLRIGQPLTVIPLALDTKQAVGIDLEQTYQQAAKRAYLA